MTFGFVCTADDDVHSWLDALNERELSRLSINLVIKQHPLFK